MPEPVPERTRHLILDRDGVLNEEAADGGYVCDPEEFRWLPGVLGALARLRAAGISVPADIALAGFDDILTLRDVTPPLTTVRLPLKRLGEIAARLVLDGDAPRQPRVVPVPGEVVLRESTLPHPPAAQPPAAR